MQCFPQWSLSIHGSGDEQLRFWACLNLTTEQVATARQPANVLRVGNPTWPTSTMGEAAENIAQ
jgi:hypothetical protein